jgi:hypothetical protein
VALMHLQKLHQARRRMEGGFFAAKAVRTLRTPVFYRAVPGMTASVGVWPAELLLRALDEARSVELACKTTGSRTDVFGVPVRGGAGAAGSGAAGAVGCGSDLKKEPKGFGWRRPPFDVPPAVSTPVSGARYSTFVIESRNAMSEEASDEKEAAALRERQERRADLPGHFIDTWSSLTWRDHMRITVGEELYDIDSYRFAMVMTLEDAEAFAQFILRRVQKQKERTAKRTAPVPESSPGPLPGSTPINSGS